MNEATELITWFDIEHLIYRKMYENEWPESITGVNVYPDEVAIRINSNNKSNDISGKFQEWFGAKYDSNEQKIYLDFSANGKKRFLNVVFEIEPDSIRITPESFKPSFSSFGLYPETRGLILNGPDFNKLHSLPPVWAFHSFKGGVGRTLHLIAFIKALSETEPPRRVLIVDADLEAPGLTWWGMEQLGKPEISFLDFLALAHYDQSENAYESIKITADRLKLQTLTFETQTTKIEHYFLPAFRDPTQLMKMPIRPENVCWQSGREWIIPELLGKLGKQLNVDAVIVDLRAGLSEISSPILLDPRVFRIIVTAPSSQSVEGTIHILKQIIKFTSLLPNKTIDDSFFPTVILSMIKYDMRESTEIEQIIEKLKVNLIQKSDSDIENGDELFDKEELIKTSIFDENLLYLKDLKSTVEKLSNSEVYKLMKKIVDSWLPVDNKDNKEIQTEKKENYRTHLEKLIKITGMYEYAESGQTSDFLITPNLKNIARRFSSDIPTAIIMGAKGSGKTYTYLQLANLKKWNKFTQKADPETSNEYDGYIWPFISSMDLHDYAQKSIDACRQYFIQENKNQIHMKIMDRNSIQTLIDNEKKKGHTDLSSWRDFWLRLIAMSMSCENEPDVLGAIQKLLAANNTRIVFLIDGIDSYFQQTKTDKVQQAAIQALCRSTVDILKERPDNRIGLLVFIRKDMVQASIEQNFGQFESRYKSLEIKWERDEALRLVAWLVKEVANLTDYVNYEGPIEQVPEKLIEKSLEGLWGIKLGHPNSREAFTADWVLATLSDFKGQLQARDLVRLLFYSAQNALTVSRTPDRLLPPSSIKNALIPCSQKKIHEIKQEITVLVDIFSKLENLKAEKKVMPFDRDEVGLNASEINILADLGLVMEYEGKYYLPEIIRKGIGFAVSTRGRVKVFTILKRALKK